MKQRIFVLTDSRVKGSKSCVALIEKFCNGSVSMLESQGNIDNKVFSFGIGDAADLEFVKEAALKGRGEHYLAKSLHDDLSNKVIDALQKSVDPTFEESLIKFNYRKDSKYVVDKHTLMEVDMTRSIGNVYRNQLVQMFYIIPRDSFDEENVFSI